MDDFNLMCEKELQNQFPTATAFTEEDYFVNIVKTHESKLTKYKLSN
jgi:hypothetical protein